MKDRRPLTLGERWRREANRGVDGPQLDQALATLPQVRNPSVRVRPGSISVEMEGAMGSINEVSIQVPTLPTKIWPQVARVMRRSTTMLEALATGKVPRSFDRLVARIAGESVFPEGRRVSHGCSCGAPESPCQHVLALHELFARRLEDRPWELLALRGIDLRDLLKRARSSDPDPDLPPLAFSATEEPVLFPEGEEGDLDTVMSEGQVAQLLGSAAGAADEASTRALEAYRSTPRDGDSAGTEAADG